MTFGNKLLTVLPCKNGDKLEIYLESEYPRIVSYFLASKRLEDCQSISEHEAYNTMYDEEFLFAEIPKYPDGPTSAAGTIEI